MPGDTGIPDHTTAQQPGYLDKIEQGVAGVIERINVLRTALKPVWARKKKAEADSLGALPIRTIEKLERRRTELMEALRKLAHVAEDLRRALDNPPTTSADPANGDDDNREAAEANSRCRTHRLQRRSPVPHNRIYVSARLVRSRRQGVAGLPARRTGRSECGQRP